MKFESFYFYTNQRALKNYLVNYKIEPSAYRNELNRTLSDLGQNFLLFWKSEIGAETILKNCKTDGGDIPVVLKVLLPAETVVEAYSPDETIKLAKISECSTAYAVKFACPVSFFNVTDIFYVDKQIQFLQGDTTLIIPKQLIRNEPFTALSALDDNIVDSVINSFSKTKDNVFSDDDEDDETELGADILSGFTDETAEEKDVRDKSQKEDKLIAAYLMFIQGKTLFDGRFSQRIYSVTGSPEIQFDKVIHDNFYKKVLQHIVSENIRYLQAKDIDYISCLKGSKSDDIYTSAITSLLNNRYSYDDKDRFLNDYIAGINDIATRNGISEIFADKRARNRIALLIKDDPELVPTYFLYTFFDYRLDRFCENITEFGLDKEGFANITLSLWALLHGMGDLYSEYKDLELLYAVTCKVNDICVDYKQFAESNKIVSKKDCITLDNLSCHYTNLKIEYYHCIGAHAEKIKKYIDNLAAELKYSFDFQYVSLKNALKMTGSEISDKEIIANKDIIHKQYLQSIAEEKPKKSRKTSKKTQDQISFID